MVCERARPIPITRPTPEQVVDLVRDIAATFFPGLAPSEAQDPGMPKSDSKRGKD